LTKIKKVDNITIGGIKWQSKKQQKNQRLKSRRQRRKNQPRRRSKRVKNATHFFPGSFAPSRLFTEVVPRRRKTSKCELPKAVSMPMRDLGV
jgi:hypothetical protein